MWIKHPSLQKAMNTDHFSEISCDVSAVHGDGPYYLIRFNSPSEECKTTLRYKSEESRDKEFNRITAMLYSQGGK